MERAATTQSQSDRVTAGLLAASGQRGKWVCAGGVRGGHEIRWHGRITKMADNLISWSL